MSAGHGLLRTAVAGPASWWLFAAAAVVAVTALGPLLGEQGPAPGPLWMSVAVATSFTPLGWFVLRRAPEHPLGPLMLAAGLTATAAAVAVCWSGLPLAAWASQWLWWPPVALIPKMLLLFPDGRPRSRRWRRLPGLLTVLTGVVTVALAGAALWAPQTLLSTVGHPLPVLPRVLVVVAFIGIGGVLLATIGVFLVLVWRWRRADQRQRGQLVCLAPAAVLVVVGVVLSTANVPGGWLPAVVALPIGMTLAILRFELWNLDLYIHRGLVWLVMIGIAVAIYALVVAGLEELIGERDSPTATLVAAAACAVALLPAERLAQRGLSRLVYGHRDDGWEVLMRVGRQIEAVRDPLDVLPRFVAALADTLQLPWAAVQVAGPPDEEPLLVAHGRRAGGDPDRYPLVVHGRQVGVLLVEARRPGTRFTASEVRLLQGLARQAGLAADASRSALELRRARERLVLAREEERRQIRRDLHDGVASALVGAQMLVEATRSAIPAGGQAGALLETLARDLTVCTGEVRSLIDGLRPAVLDAGLAAALTEVAERVSATLPVTLQIAGDLDDLAAAAEVVIYRIVTEALNNVIKHAAATRAWVEVTRDDQTIAVLVGDDGVGVPVAGVAQLPGSGVGLPSLRSRVVEVGGLFAVESDSAGTRCRAVLPLPDGAPPA